MPFDPTHIGEITVAPLSQLTPDGSWQVELAHDLTENLLIWITRGQGRVFLNGQQRGFGPNSAIFVPAGTLWSLELGRQCIGQVMTIPASTPMDFPDSADTLRIPDAQDQAVINSMFQAMQAEQQDRPALWYRAMQAHGTLIAIHVRRLMAARNSAISKPTAAQRLAQGYCGRIVECYAQHASMADHAAALNVTPTHLTRVCKSETGKTAGALLTERQLHAARSLLITSELPMRDIAATLGFGSAAYFTRFITQHTGETPPAAQTGPGQTEAQRLIRQFWCLPPAAPGRPNFTIQPTFDQYGSTRTRQAALSAKPCRESPWQRRHGRTLHWALMPSTKAFEGAFQHSKSKNDIQNVAKYIRKVDNLH
ncbi:AraC family transcriptional regulator [Phaeobacter piscinae]|uniref:AraC family transcriptional regulator n=1 Tax=Phaeobacter piscinae TaxID=1580596 RepID=UPI0039F657EC